jgi:hypothetical protein
MFDQVWGYYSSTITENIQVLDLKSEDTLVRINSETVILVLDFKAKSTLVRINKQKKDQISCLRPHFSAEKIGKSKSVCWVG